MRRAKYFHIIKYPCCLLLCAGLGCLLLLVTGLDTPGGFFQSRINGNIEQSVPLFEREGLYPNLLGQGTQSTKADNYSETLILQSAMYTNTSKNPLNIFINPFRGGSEGMVDHFIAASKGDPSNSSYFHYWQGFRAFVRPLLTIFDYSSIRELIRFAGLFLFFVTSLVVYRNAGRKFAAIFCVSLLSIEYFIAATTIQYSIVFFIAMIAMILLPVIIKKQWSIPLFFFITGAVTQFFDFYTVPCVTLGFPLIFLIELKSKDQTSAKKSHLRLIVFCILAWFGSYIGMWMIRLALVSLFLNINAFVPVLDLVFKWTGVAKNESYAYLGPFDGIKRSFHTAFTRTKKVLLISGIVCYVVFLARAIHLRVIKKPNYLFLPSGIIPIVWMIITAKATAWHTHFQYRSVAVILFACFSFALSVFDRDSTKKPHS